MLQGVNLEIPERDFVALMGPSGSGKTTLLNLIGGLDTPTEGVVEVQGVGVSSLRGSALSQWRSAHIGFVFQLYNLLPKLTAEKNVELPLLLTSLSKKASRASCDRIEGGRIGGSGKALPVSVIGRSGAARWNCTRDCNGSNAAVVR